MALQWGRGIEDQRCPAGGAGPSKKNGGLGQAVMRKGRLMSAFTAEPMKINVVPLEKPGLREIGRTRTGRCTAWEEPVTYLQVDNPRRRAQKGPR